MIDEALIYFLQKKYVSATVLSLLLLTLFRFVSVFSPSFALQVDEAQYAGWGHALAFGYFSKPPFIAWMLYFGKSTCDIFNISQVEGCTRMLQAPALLIASGFVMATAWQLFAELKTTVFSGLLFITLPFVGFYSLVATTDPWLMMWWAIALYAFVVACKQPLRWWPWLLCGVAIGFGALSKYAMLVFLLSAILWMIKQPVLHSRVIVIRYVLGALLAAIVFIPNLIWNYQQGFPTIEHHVALSHVDQLQTHAWHAGHALLELITFLSSQFVVFGPLAFIVLLWFTFSKSIQLKESDADALRLLQCFIWPMLGLMMIEALISRAFANWALAAYVAASIAVAAYCCKQYEQKIAATFIRGKHVLVVSILLGFIASVCFVVMPHWLQSDDAMRSAKHNTLRKLDGWKEVALWAKAYVTKHPMPVIASDRYLLAELSTYGYPETYPPYAWNPSGKKENHYQWFYDLSSMPNTGKTMLFILTGTPTEAVLARLKAAFEIVESVQDVELAALRVGKEKRPVFAFEVQKFQGY